MLRLTRTTQDFVQIRSGLSLLTIARLVNISNSKQKKNRNDAIQLLRTWVVQDSKDKKPHLFAFDSHTQSAKNTHFPRISTSKRHSENLAFAQHYQIGYGEQLDPFFYRGARFPGGSTVEIRREKKVSFLSADSHRCWHFHEEPSETR